MKSKKDILKKPWLQSVVAIVVIFGALGGFLYWHSSHNTVAIDNSLLDAPIADISPSAPGQLNALYVKEGDRVAANAPLALVGSETLFSKEAGIVTGDPQGIGSYFAPGQKVLSVIVDSKMRVVGSIDETKGLAKLKEGQHATFTVDAFPGKSYEGTVDEISPASSDSGIAFSISDKRPVKKFDVYVRFDTSKYPELKTGMSAKIRVHLK
jgi:multidrug resistance efflux pump